MQFVEIFIRQNPWTDGRALIGVLAEDPVDHSVTVLSAFAAKDRGTVATARRALRDLLGGHADAITSAARASERRKRDRAATAFLSALARAVERSTDLGQDSSLDALLKCVPDRGASCYFSTVQLGEFPNAQAALHFCIEREASRAHAVQQQSALSHPQLQST